MEEGLTFELEWTLGLLPDLEGSVFFRVPSHAEFRSF